MRQYLAAMILGNRTLALSTRRMFHAILRRGPRVVYTVLDQGLFSGASFALNLLLLHASSAATYGVFSLASVMFLILSGIHNCLILEPLSVLGSSLETSNSRHYFGYIILLHTMLCIVLSAISMPIIMLAVPESSKDVFLWMAVSLVASLLPWTVRRICYIQSDPKAAAQGSAVYFASLLTFSFLLSWFDHLSGLTAFVSIAAASILASVATVTYMPVRPRVAVSMQSLTRTAEVLRDHWSIGKWVVAQGVFGISTAYLPVLVAGLNIGTAAAGTLRALGLVNQPIQQAMTAIGGLLVLPVLAKSYTALDHEGLARKVRLLNSAFLLATVIHVGILIACMHLVVRFLPDTTALSTSWLVPIMGLGAFISAIGAGEALALRASRRVIFYPLSTFVPGTIGLVLTPWLTIRYGVLGGIASGLAVGLVGSMVSIILYRLWITPTKLGGSANAIAP